MPPCKATRAVNNAAQMLIIKSVFQRVQHSCSVLNYTVCSSVRSQNTRSKHIYRSTVLSSVTASLPTTKNLSLMKLLMTHVRNQHERRITPLLFPVHHQKKDTHRLPCSTSHCSTNEHVISHSELLSHSDLLHIALLKQPTCRQTQRIV